jgi:hypothetical protein
VVNRLEPEETTNVFQFGIKFEPYLVVLAASPLTFILKKRKGSVNDVDFRESRMGNN